ncbi:hypothetical protein MHUMG1_02785 [Metarhizium humberi]|uniref:BRCT domain-containing protein n=1 Tax=Metarhizium humberi TaxID=2596975 RepID=A0A9P8MIK7_9HYPO|nr:hypothetical protein MHUMG1_02785 [Metarhizium humberi]
MFIVNVDETNETPKKKIHITQVHDEIVPPRLQKPAKTHPTRQATNNRHITRPGVHHTLPTANLEKPSPCSRPPPPSLPKPALPRNTAFDPWNSSSTGHQRAEQQPGTAWRASRTGKLNSQFQSGPAGGPRTQDTRGPGVRGASVADMLRTPGLMGESLGDRPPRQDDDAAAPRGIFAGCVVYVNGSTYPLVSDHRLKHELCKNGAQIFQPLEPPYRGKRRK